MFEVEWSAQAVSDLRTLERPIALRIMQKVMDARDSPHHFLERMVGSERWKLRVGDYRAILRLDENKKKLFVIMVGHRKNVYK